MSDQDLVVNHWRRWGKDRLYVETSEGARVGFWDLAGDTGHPESAECEDALLAAVARWREQQPHKERAKDVGRPGLETAAPPTPDEAVTTLLAAGPLEAEVDTEPEPVVNDAGPHLPTRPWVDLATNRAGAAAREQANAARDAAPVRTVLTRVLGVHTDERAWRIGADGEEKVAAQLGKVQRRDPRWRFVHAVPVGGRGSDIDHVIIGPGGVFTANAKHHPDAKIWVGGSTFIVNGSKQPYVRNARHEAQRAARLLSEACNRPIHVEGVIVTVNAKNVVVKSQPEGVTVIPRMQLTTWLLRHGDILTSEQVDAIYEVARRSTTWR